MMKPLLAAALAATFSAALISAAPSHAQTFPSRPISIFVPFAPGGPTDVIARALAEHMRSSLGHSVVVENVVGANSNGGGARVARVTPKDVIAALNAAVSAALADNQIKTRLASLGQDIYPPERRTPEALSAFHLAEIAKWWPIIKAAGIKAE